MGKDNLPEKLKIEKKKSFLDEVQAEMIASTIEGLLPKIKPFIKPAVEKFNEFLGDNTHTIVIKRLPNGNPTVFIFDNTKGNYKIENNLSEKINIFTASAEPSPIKDIYDINMFVEKLLTGELINDLKNK